MFSLTQKGEHRKIAEKFRKQQVFSNDMKVNPPEFIKFSFNLNLTDIGRSISSHTPVEILYFSISSKKAKLGWEMLAGRVSFNHTVNENEYDKLSKECLPRINGELKELTWLDVIFLALPQIRWVG